MFFAPSIYDALERNAQDAAILKETIKSFLEKEVIDGSFLEEMLNSLEEKEINTEIRDTYTAKKILKKLEPQISEYYAQKIAAGREYYRDIFCKEKQRAVVFDCGYSGSISVGIQTALEDSISVDKVYIFETDKNRRRDAQNGTKSYVLSKKMYEFNILMCELLLSSTEGTCVGFSKKEDVIVPVTMDANMDKNTLALTHHVQTCILETLEAFINDFSIYNKNMIFDGLIDSVEPLMSSWLDETHIRHLFREFTFCDSYGNRKETLEDILTSFQCRKLLVNKKKPTVSLKRIQALFLFVFVNIKRLPSRISVWRSLR